MPAPPARTSVDLNRYRDLIHAWAQRKGWWSPAKSYPEQVALFHSELAEALEHWRNGHEPTDVFHTHPEHVELQPDGQMVVVAGASKPDGVPIELADVVIRVLDTCGWYGIALPRFYHQSPFALLDNHVRVGASFGEHIEYLHWVVAQCHGHEGRRSRQHRLATVLYAVAAVARRFDIDLWDAVDIKMAYNETRSERHGGKRI